MEDLLTVKCFDAPTDTMTLSESEREGLCFLHAEADGEDGLTVTLTTETAEQLRDALTEWLEAQ